MLRIFFSLFMIVTTNYHVLLAQTVPEQVTVRGHVYDSAGLPVSDVSIDVLPLEIAFSGSLPHATTDDKGSYSISIPPYGKVRICAQKESAGFPDTRFLIFAPAKRTMPEVTIVRGAPLADVDIHLGEPNGTFGGNVVDTETLQPITTARITIRRVDNPRAMISSNVEKAVFSYVLPPNPVEVRISAAGYIDWIYTDSATGKNELVLKPRQRNTVTVAMQRLSKR
jgi:hypothetical protein